MKFSTSALVCAIAAFTPALVSAHGYLGQMSIDGKVYKGNSPGSGGAASAIRQVADINPIYGAGNKAINCGTNAKPAALNAVANAGSSIAFKWTGGGGQNWPHNTGPVITYMASCGSTTCDKFDSSKAKWFKIGQAGKNGNNVWEQAKFQSGQSLSSTIPANLASGNYLVRSEIIALHAASYLGAEYYPACAQLIVKGNGKGTPSANELVSIPGAYSDKVNNVSPYTNGAYKFPGPAIAKLAATSANLAVETPAAPVSSSPEAASPATEDDEDIPYCDEEEDNDSEDSDEEPTPAAAEQDAPNKAAINPTKYANSTEKSNKPYGRATHPRSMSRIMRNIVFSS